MHKLLEPAMDAAVSAGAANSIEKMFWHQRATVHFLGMKAAAKALDDNALSGRELPPLERVRLMNAAARMFDTYQNGMLVWKRWTSDATQTVKVQHLHQQVQVGSGGQALVAGSVKAAGGARRRAGSANKASKPDDQ